MSQLNFNHLYYFWSVVREGSVTKASRMLHVAQPTISVQIKQLEESMGHALFRRQGKKLSLTEQGRVAFDYAEQIFRLGQEMTQAIQGVDGAAVSHLNVGVMDVLPKHLIYHYLQPALADQPGLKLRCLEGKLEYLLMELANYRLDLVLSDSPLFHHLPVKTQTHFLGESDLVVMGSCSLVESTSDDPLVERIRKMPVLLPTANTAMRRILDRWFDAEKLEPVVAGEFEDSGLLKVFAMQGHGLCFVPQILEALLGKLYKLQSMGRIAAGKARFFAITAERRQMHPVIRRLTQAASLGIEGRQAQESHDEISLGRDA